MEDNRILSAFLSWSMMKPRVFFLAREGFTKGTCFHHCCSFWWWRLLVDLQIKLKKWIFWKVFRLVTICPSLTFADDTLNFCKPNESNLSYLRCILLFSKAVSGLRVSFSKSVIIPIGEVSNSSPWLSSLVVGLITSHCLQ